MTFAVLFVCTGNLCRSPIAERLFRLGVGPLAPVAVRSAGTAGLSGAPMDAPSAQALRELGGNPDGHLSRRLTPDLIRLADLILTAETLHRSLILQAEPLVYRQTFTLREFVRMGASVEPFAGEVTVLSLRERVERIAEQRGRGSPAEPRQDDIRDPYGRSIDVARTCAAEISLAIDAVIAVLGVKGFVT